MLLDLLSRKNNIFDFRILITSVDTHRYIMLNISGFNPALLMNQVKGIVTSVDPVKAILSTSGWCVSAAPAVGPYPGTTLTTPGGNPASLIRAATASAVRGVCSAGFRTIVHPYKEIGNFDDGFIIILYIVFQFSRYGQFCTYNFEL